MRLLKRWPRLYAVVAAMIGRQIIVLDYPVQPRPRWGHGKPEHAALHDIINRGRGRYADTLGSFLKYQSDFAKISLRAAEDTSAPHWINDWLPAGDAVALYSFIADRKPATYLEVGSGISTLFARQAVRDHGLPTKIISIDPHPRASIDAVCDRVIRRPLEEVDFGIFKDLQAGDVVFVDNSHRAFMNSDVTVFFLDILPTLPVGVLVGIHDIFLPSDYTQDLADHFYSEQYLLAAYLLGGGKNMEIILPMWFASHHSELSSVIAPLFAQGPLQQAARHGGAFWFESV